MLHVVFETTYNLTLFITPVKGIGKVINGMAAKILFQQNGILTKRLVINLIGFCF